MLAAAAAVEKAPDVGCNDGCMSAFQVSVGHDWADNSSLIAPSPVGGIDSARDCQAKCYALTICVTFTYNGGRVLSYNLAINALPRP